MTTLGSSVEGAENWVGKLISYIKKKLISCAQHLLLSQI